MRHCYLSMILSVRKTYRRGGVVSNSVIRCRKCLVLKVYLRLTYPLIAAARPLTAKHNQLPL